MTRLLSGLFVIGMAMSATAPNTLAANRAIIFGGNCDGPVAGSTFLYNMASTSAALSRQGWDVVNLYDGKNARCSLPATDPQCAGSQPASKSSQCCPVGVSPALWSVSAYAKVAGIRPDQVRSGSRDELIRELKSSLDMKPGDQLLVIFETHGSEAAPKQALGHGLCTSGYGTVGDQKLVFGENGLSRDPFYKALDTLKAKGVKMGFVDDSCYSGGSIQNFSKYGCVVAATTAHRPATGLPVSQGLVEFLTGKDWSHGEDRIDAPAGPLELQSGRISLADLYLKSLFTGSSLLYSARLREISGFTPGNDFAEKFAHDFIPADLGPSGDDLEAPDYDVNDSSDWSNAACVEQLDQQIGGLSDLIKVAVTVNDIDSAHDREIVSGYTSDLKRENHVFGTRAFDQDVPPQEIVNDLNARLARYKDFMRQYTALAQHEKDLLGHILDSRLPIQFHFDGELSGAENAFWKALTSNTGVDARLADPKTGKIANPVLWRNIMDVVGLSPAALLDREKTTASIVASQMKAQGYPGVTPQFENALARMMTDSIQQGWQSLPRADQQDLLRTSRDYVDTQIKMGESSNDFAYHDNFRSTVNLRLAQAQAFKYLGYMDYLSSHSGELTPAQANDYDALKACSSFTLAAPSK